MAISIVDALLTPVDPGRALQQFISELDELAALDPKLDRARARISDAVAAMNATADEQEILGAVFWLHIRGRVTSQPAETAELIRRWLGDGDLVLRTVDDALRTTLTPEVLQSVVDGAKTYDAAQSDDPATDRGRPLAQARDELRRIQGERAEDNPAVVAGAVVAVVIGAAIGVVVAEIVHSGHHR
jgi:hypothetical protein